MFIHSKLELNPFHTGYQVTGTLANRNDVHLFHGIVQKKLFRKAPIRNAAEKTSCWGLSTANFMWVFLVKIADNYFVTISQLHVFMFLYLCLQSDVSECCLILSLIAVTCWLLITFANNLDPDQDRQNFGPDLDQNCMTLSVH